MGGPRGRCLPLDKKNTALPNGWTGKRKQVEGVCAGCERASLDRYSAEVRPVFGNFPGFRGPRGERGNAVCSAFGQDGFELAKYADVFVSYVVSRESGDKPPGLGRIYGAILCGKRFPCEVWPIVQSMDFTFEEFADVMRYAGEGGGHRGVGRTHFRRFFEKKFMGWVPGL